MVKEESFSGFPKKGLQFLEDLRNNNNREWFKARKQDYEKYILVPAKAFVVSLGELLKTLSNDLEYDTRTSGQGSIMRIYRDIRFSKDKTPYNTRLRIRFWEGSKKKSENPGFFFGMDANEAHLYGGLHMFPKPVLASYRDAVIDDRLGKELDAALKSLKSAGGYELGGEQYKRVPRGYDSSHKRAAWLKYKGLHILSPKIESNVLTKPKLVDICFDHCKAMFPLHEWLVKVDKLAK